MRLPIVLMSLHTEVQLGISTPEADLLPQGKEIVPGWRLSWENTLPVHLSRCDTLHVSLLSFLRPHSHTFPVIVPKI